MFYFEINPTLIRLYNGFVLGLVVVLSVLSCTMESSKDDSETASETQTVEANKPPTSVPKSLDSSLSASSRTIETTKRRSMRFDQMPIADVYGHLERSGLVRVAGIDSSIHFDLKYATEDNFAHENLYGELREAYLQREVATKLIRAQQLLKQRHPSYSLLVFDAYRPRSVQFKMWKHVVGTVNERYLANPSKGKGSLHNLGVAVDLSIIDSLGRQLDMGTPYDFFGRLAEPRYQEEFLQTGELTQKHVANRALLHDVMIEAGFRSIPREWWHFDGFARPIAEQKYNAVPL